MAAKCANCGIEIRWQPTVIDGVVYCCLGCSRGGPCDCNYSDLPNGADRLVPVVCQDQNKEDKPDTSCHK